MIRAILALPQGVPRLQGGQAVGVDRAEEPAQPSHGFVVDVSPRVLMERLGACCTMMGADRRVTCDPPDGHLCLKTLVS